MNAERLHKGQYSGRVAGLKTTDGLLAGITSYTPEDCNPHFHSHENPHLILLLNGGNVYNSRRQSSEKMAGDVLFYHSDEVHQTLPGTVFSKCINLEVEDEFMQRNGLTEEILQRAAISGPDARFLLIRMYKELLADDAHTDTSLQVLFLGMLAGAQKPVKRKPVWLDTLLALLHDEWNSTPTLEYLSKTVGIHPVTVSKYFTRYMGCTLGDYLRKLKLEKSIARVRSGNDTLTQVAADCGFADQSHFTRGFKAYTGFLPKEFRAL